MALKFKEPQTIRATYRIVTPMFIGDAEQKASGISPTSVKGALRFWWRALNWGELRSESLSDAAALEKLNNNEGILFGTTADGGQAAGFTLRVNQEVKISRKRDWPSGRQNDPSSYLGLGLWSMGLQPQREYIDEGQSFEISLQVDDKIAGEQIASLKSAMKALGLFGGLGSRSRRGFGSISLKTLDSENFNFECTDSYIEAVTEAFSIYRKAEVFEPPYSAISKDAVFAISQKGVDSPRKAHAQLGELFKNYRGQPSSMRGPKKRVFGMPYSDGGKAESEARRASPLLMHIHPIGDKFVNTTLFLPAEFHSDPSLAAVDYSLASGFLKTLPEVVVV